MLRGEFVILRVPEMDDAGIMSGWKNDREVTKYLPPMYPASKMNQENYIKQVSRHGCSITFVMETEDEIPIGICSLDNIDWINSTAEIKVVIYAKNCWGRGYGYDAVNTLTNYGIYQMNLNTIYANILEGNERAIKCFEKAGYEIEGTLRQRVLKEGEYKNLVSLSITKRKNQGE